MDMTNPTDAASQPPKKKGGCCGCGCFLSGCLILILMIVLPIVGGGVYFASLTNEQWGDKIMWLVKNPSFATGFKNGIQESKEMSDDEKKAFIQMYDELVENYDHLEPAQQAKVKQDLIVVIKAFIKDPDTKTPPPELMDLMQILQPGMLDMTAPDGTPATTPPPPGAQNTQPTDANPYDFGNTPQTPQPPQQPPQQVQPPAENKDQFNF
jgi:hypothetical protein